MRNGVRRQECGCEMVGVSGFSAMWAEDEGIWELLVEKKGR